MTPMRTTTPADAGLHAGQLERITDFMRDEIARKRLPGAVMMVARRGAIAWTQAIGQLDPARDAAMSEDAIFRVYSMTKPIVSTALMMLAERGRLQLSDPVQQWLPEFASPKVLVEASGGASEVPAGAPITVQDLLRHTSGLTYGFLGTSELHRRYTQADATNRRRSSAEVCTVLAGLPLAFRPGSRWEYSHATDVVGRLVEVISGRTLGAFLADEILGPLGMTDTAFQVPAAQHHRIAEPFASDPVTGEDVRLLEPRVAATLESGGGGLMSTVADYVKFLQLFLNGGSYGGVRLLGRKTVALMTADHLGDIPRESPLLPRGYGFGLGFAVRTHAGLAPIAGSVGEYHWGGIAGTQFWVDPQEQLIALLMTQAPGLRDYYRPIFRNMVNAAIV